MNSMKQLRDLFKAVTTALAVGAAMIKRINVTVDENIAHSARPDADVQLIGLSDELRTNPKKPAKAATSQGKSNFVLRSMRATFIILIPVLLMIALVIKKEFGIKSCISLPRIIGYGLLMMFVVYFTFIACFIFPIWNDKNRKLYRIYSISLIVNDWANLCIGHGQLKYPEMAIESISELSAIHGGLPKLMLNTLGIMTWISVILHYGAEIIYNPQFIWDQADICLIFGAMGLLLISIFELDPFNKNMCLFHYIGASLGSLNIFAFYFQQKSRLNDTGIFVSKYIGIIAIISFIIWQYSGKCYSLYAAIFNKSRNVTKFAIWCIVWEAICLFMGALSLCLFLILYHIDL